MNNLHLYDIASLLEANIITSTVKKWGINAVYTPLNEFYEIKEHFIQPTSDNILIVLCAKSKLESVDPFTRKPFLFEHFINSFHFNKSILINTCTIESPYIPQLFIERGLATYFCPSYNSQEDDVFKYLLEFLRFYFYEKQNVVKAHMKAYRIYPSMLCYQASLNSDSSAGHFDYPGDIKL